MQLIDVVPLEVDDPRGVRVERNLASVQALDLTREAIAVLEQDDVGFRQRDRCGQSKRCREQHRGGYARQRTCLARGSSDDSAFHTIPWAG